MTEFILNENDTSTEQPQGKGYLNSNYYGRINEEAAQQAQGATQDEQLINALSEKLGIPVDGVQQEQEGAVPQTQEEKDDFIKRLGTEEGKKLVDDFKKVTGIDLQEAFGIVQNTAKLTKELDAWRQQVLVERQSAELRQEWGKDFDVIMPQVIEAFKKLPPVMQKALDNPDGARLLAAQIRQSTRSQSQASPYVPSGNVRNVGRNGLTPPVIRMSEMVTWSGAELDKRMPDIIRAKQAGTIVHDL